MDINGDCVQWHQNACCKTSSDVFFYSLACPKFKQNQKQYFILPKSHLKMERMKVIYNFVWIVVLFI